MTAIDVKNRKSSPAELAARFSGLVQLASQPQGVPGERVSTVSVPTGGSGDREEDLSSGEERFDQRFGGLPRGSLSDFVGAASSGKLSLLLGLLREVLQPRSGAIRPGLAALIDLGGTVFPSAAWARGRLLVVRPAQLTEGLRALDILLASGCFEVIAFEASGGELPMGFPRALRPRTAQLARETGTAVLASAERPVFGNAAALRLELSRTPRGELHAAVRKNRKGPLGELLLPRPSFPFLAALSEQLASPEARIVPDQAMRRAIP
jgi:hypothetical protein